MKTKRQVLEEIVKTGKCRAMAILRQNRKKRGFNPNKVLTCVTAAQAKVGMKGYFSDNLVSLREQFARKNIQTLTRVFSEEVFARFEADNMVNWALFYPIEGNNGYNL